MQVAVWPCSVKEVVDSVRGYYLAEPSLIEYGNGISLTAISLGYRSFILPSLPFKVIPAEYRL